MGQLHHHTGENYYGTFLKRKAMQPSFVRAAAIATSVFAVASLPAAPAEAFEIIRTQSRIPTAAFTSYGGSEIAFATPGSLGAARHAMFQQTITANTAGQPATLNFHAGLNDRGRILTSFDVSPLGNYGNTNWQLEIRFWRLSQFNPNDLTQGVAGIQLINNISAPLTRVGSAPGFSSVFNMQYQFLTPVDADTYYIGFGLATIPGMTSNIMRSNRPIIVAEGIQDYTGYIAADGSGSSFNPFVAGSGQQRISLSLDINSVPTPGALAVGALGLAVAYRRRR